MSAQTDRQKLRASVQEAYSNWQKAKAALMKAAVSGYASVSISTGAGSKSYSNLSTEALRALVDTLKQEYMRLRSLYSVQSRLPWPIISRIETIRG